MSVAVRAGTPHLSCATPNATNVAQSSTSPLTSATSPHPHPPTPGQPDSTMGASSTPPQLMKSKLKTDAMEVQHQTTPLSTYYGLPYQFVLQDHNYGAPPPPSPPPSAHLSLSGASLGGTGGGGPKVNGLRSSVFRDDDETSTSLASNASANRDERRREETAQDSVTRCICEFDHDDEYMICCDKCSVWQHVDCMGLDRSNIPETYLCEKCHPRKVDRQKAKALQTRKRGQMTDSTSSDESTGSSPPTVNQTGQRHNSQQLQTMGGAGGGHPTLAQHGKARKIGRRKRKSSSHGGGSSGRDSLSNAGVTAAIASVVGVSKRRGRTRDKAEAKRLNAAKRKAANKTILDFSHVNEDAQDSDLKRWICDYEEAMVNQYSPELLLKLSKIRSNGQHDECVKRASAHLRLHLCKVAQVTDNTKGLVASEHLVQDRIVCEYRGKFLLGSQFRQQNPLPSGHLPPPYVLRYCLPALGTGSTTISPPAEVTARRRASAVGGGEATDSVATRQVDSSSSPPTIPSVVGAAGTVSEEVWVDARHYGNVARWVRRSCRPNAQLRHLLEDGALRLYVMTSREVRPDEEITVPFDFDPTICDERYACACAKMNCLMLTPPLGKNGICNSRRRRNRSLSVHICSATAETTAASDDTSPPLIGAGTPAKIISPGRQPPSYSLPPSSTTSFTTSLSPGSANSAALASASALPAVADADCTSSSAPVDEDSAAPNVESSGVGDTTSNGHAATQNDSDDSDAGGGETGAKDEDGLGGGGNTGTSAADRRKMTREERKMEAIMKAFERMEKAEQRRQEAQARQQQRNQQKKDDPQPRDDTSTTLLSSPSAPSLDTPLPSETPSDQTAMTTPTTTSTDVVSPTKSSAAAVAGLSPPLAMPTMTVLSPELPVGATGASIIPPMQTSSGERGSSAAASAVAEVERLKQPVVVLHVIQAVAPSPLPPLPPQRVKGKGRKRKSSGAAGRRSSRANSGSSEVLSSQDESSQQSLAQLSSPLPSLALGLGSPCGLVHPGGGADESSWVGAWPRPGTPAAAAGESDAVTVLNAISRLKTKRHLMNEWLIDSSLRSTDTDTTTITPSSSSSNTGGASAGGCSSPNSYVRRCRSPAGGCAPPHASSHTLPSTPGCSPSTTPSLIGSVHLRRTSFGESFRHHTATLDGSLGSAKKRWLRQAMTEDAESCLPNGAASPTPTGGSNANSPNTPNLQDIITPLKKRRLARESDDATPTSPALPSDSSPMDTTSGSDTATSITSTHHLGIESCSVSATTISSTTSAAISLLLCKPEPKPLSGSSNSPPPIQLPKTTSAMVNQNAPTRPPSLALHTLSQPMVKVKEEELSPPTFHRPCVKSDDVSSSELLLKTEPCFSDVAQDLRMPEVSRQRKEDADAELDAACERETMPTTVLLGSPGDDKAWPVCSSSPTIDPYPGRDLLGTRGDPRRTSSDNRHQVQADQQELAVDLSVCMTTATIPATTDFVCEPTSSLMLSTAMSRLLVLPPPPPPACSPPMNTPSLLPRPFPTLSSPFLPSPFPSLLPSPFPSTVQQQPSLRLSTETPPPCLSPTPDSCTPTPPPETCMPPIYHLSSSPQPVLDSSSLVDAPSAEASAVPLLPLPPLKSALVSRSVLAPLAEMDMQSSPSLTSSQSIAAHMSARTLLTLARATTPLPMPSSHSPLVADGGSLAPSESPSCQSPSQAPAPLTPVKRKVSLLEYRQRKLENSLCVSSSALPLPKNTRPPSPGNSSATCVQPSPPPVSPHDATHITSSISSEQAFSLAGCSSNANSSSTSATDISAVSSLLMLSGASERSGGGTAMTALDGDISRWDGTATSVERQRENLAQRLKREFGLTHEEDTAATLVSSLSTDCTVKTADIPPTAAHSYSYGLQHPSHFSVPRSQLTSAGSGVSLGRNIPTIVGVRSYGSAPKVGMAASATTSPASPIPPPHFAVSYAAYSRSAGCPTLTTVPPPPPQHTASMHHSRPTHLQSFNETTAQLQGVPPPPSCTAQPPVSVSVSASLASTTPDATTSSTSLTSGQHGVTYARKVTK